MAADNVIASPLGRSTKHYYYRDRGLLVDLSGRDAVARPFGVEFNGTAALALTRAYHLYSLPSGPARMRVAANWLIQALLGCDVSRLGSLNRSVETLVDVEQTPLPQTRAGQGGWGWPWAIAPDCRGPVRRGARCAVPGALRPPYRSGPGQATTSSPASATAARDLLVAERGRAVDFDRALQVSTRTSVTPGSSLILPSPSSRSARRSCR